MKETMSRADFLTDSFAFLVETKGYLLSWERASICPCRPVVPTTEQPDPNCALCKGAGWLYFGLETPITDFSDIGDLDEVQQKIVQQNNAMVIRGVITSIQNDYNPWDRFGNWMSGSMMLTVRHENKIGYYDRLTILDSSIVYVEVRDATGDNTLPLRYLATGVNYLRSFDRVYKADVDFDIVEGHIRFYEGKAPSSGERLSIHYICHPTVLVVEHPHVIRQTTIQKKVQKPKTVRGDPAGMPIQAMVRYDFIPEPS